MNSARLLVSELTDTDEEMTHICAHNLRQVSLEALDYSQQLMSRGALRHIDKVSFILTTPTIEVSGAGAWHVRTPGQQVVITQHT